MGKHGHFKNRNRRQKGFGTKGSGNHHGLAARLKVWNEIIDGKTQTHATLTSATTAVFQRPGCKASGYRKPGSNKK